MNPFREKKSPQNEDPSYPSSIKSMSEKWRSIREKEQDERQGGFFERNFLAVGIGIALLIIALIIVIGGFSFLVWNAR